MSKPDKREEILRAALEQIAEKGFHGASMAMIATRAKVSVGSIYRYFESKDDLICETYAFLEGLLLATVKAHYAEGRPLRDRFLHVGQKLVTYFKDSPFEFRFFKQYHNSPYGVANRRERTLDNVGNNVFLELFDVGGQQQTLKDLPPQVLFSLAFGPLMAISRNHILQHIELEEAIIARTVEACWDAVRR